MESSKLSAMEPPTIKSVTELLEFFKTKLEKTDESVYPIEHLCTIIRLLNLASTTKGLEECLEKESTRALIKLVKERITPPDPLTLLSRGYDKDDFDQIQCYTNIFEEIAYKISRQSSRQSSGFSTSSSSDEHGSPGANDSHRGGV